ncbi:MAG: NUDIX hydrolase [bacterium]|jgi:8-oxo-dGTP diphosphatase|nr:NUDIX hydrolase [bacterium]
MGEDKLHKYYPHTEKILVAVNCIVFGFEAGQLKLLLLKRNIEPASGKWAIPGGFVNVDESLKTAGRRILNDLTGLEDLYMEQLHAYGDVDRDPGARVISVAFYALIKVNEYTHQSVEEHDAHWIQFSDIPDLIFDHNDMMDNALQHLRTRARYQPIGFHLLPEKFTLPELQKLYEALYQKELDKRNFRKKILSMGFLDKLDDKDKSSRRGAFYYRFNKVKYDELVSKGFNFEV